MKTPYTYRAEKFIKLLFPYIKEELEREQRSPDDMYNCVRAFNEEKKRQVIFDSGASRMVFISSDYVVKVDSRSECWAGLNEDEYKMYLFAQEQGFGHLFAPSSRIEYNGYYFNIMPRVHSIDESRDEDFFYDNLNEDEYNFITSFINDIHGGNFGYLRGDLVLIDYAFNFLPD